MTMDLAKRWKTLWIKTAAECDLLSKQGHNASMHDNFLLDWLTGEHQEFINFLEKEAILSENNQE